MISARKVCRACGSSRLTLVLDLGNTALANDFLEQHEVRDYSRSFPLRLLLCPDCSLVQLADVVDAKVLYSRYAYVTSTSRTMDEHLRQLCDDLLSAGGFAFNAPLKVLEFGSNTGNLLKKFQARGCDVLGVEPAANISLLADREGVPTRTDFLGEHSAREIEATWGKADLIVGRHVFAHIDDWHGMVRAFHLLTDEPSVIALEVPYLVDFFEEVQFDTVYHEHLSYVSARSMQALLADSPLELHQLLRYPVHGGSIVFLLRHRSTDREVHPSVREALVREEEIGLSQTNCWRHFSDRVNSVRAALPALIRELRSQGKRIVGYGASAKGNTLLNCCKLDVRDLDYIIDNTPFKQEKLAPGSWIPVRPPEALLADQPDFALLLAWNFAKEIIGREEEYQRRGGRFIIPIPIPRIVQFGI
jgi:novobiocin biosynthesis protein NovU/D-mycarose 3-C-methyltransferase